MGGKAQKRPAGTASSAPNDALSEHLLQLFVSQQCQHRRQNVISSAHKIEHVGFINQLNSDTFSFYREIVFIARESTLEDLVVPGLGLNDGGIKSTLEQVQIVSP